MASSVFLGAFGTLTGASINPSVPIAFPDGSIGAPAITWINSLTSGWYRAGATDFRFSLAGVDLVQFNNTALNLLVGAGTISVPSGGSFSLSSTGFITATGTTGLFQFRNATVSSGVDLDVATDGILKIRLKDNSAYGTLDCLALKSSGAACPSFGPAAVASITVVNGLITAIS